MEELNRAEVQSDKTELLPKAQFVTKTEISRKTLTQINWDAEPTSYAFKVYVGGCILFVLVGIAAILGQSLGLGIMAVVALCVFTALIFARVHIEVNLQMKRIQEEYGVDSLFAESGFTDDAVYVTNECSQVTKTIPYEKIAYMTDKKDFLYIISKAKRTVTVNKHQLSEEELSRLMAFLQGKGIQKKQHGPWPK